jgi:hypothetical protein
VVVLVFVVTVDRIDVLLLRLAVANDDDAFRKREGGGAGSKEALRKH